ncbi:MAG: hypothetical protein IH933_15165 [Euryarchaeota archaeon]|nr:hypothetical protein [Euryarchaeota archaeon]
MSSDEFDKEAEREKLREKYAKEEQDREATQRMSELLLQGATMTNSHCDRCGDPIFRYEGQEFCASCQAAGGGMAAGNGQSAPAESAASVERRESEAGRAVADDERADPVDTASQPSEEQESDAEATQSVETREPRAETRSVSAGESMPADGDLAGAREELGRTISRLARRAGESNDPRRAREFLEAAGEAASTLERLDSR